MRRPLRIATYLASLALVLVAVGGFLGTTQAGAVLLLYLLERQSSPVTAGMLSGQVDAIAVLGGRTSRIDYAARLHRETGIPLLLVGKGTGDSGFEAESEKMEDILLRRYGVGPRWVETESLDTRENALFAWCLVSSMNVRSVALVTDPRHMPRARRRFEAAGFRVIAAPAPDGTPPLPPLTRESFIPGKSGIEAARRPLREWAGAWAWPLEDWLHPPRPCPGACSLPAGCPGAEG